MKSADNVEAMSLRHADGRRLTIPVYDIVPVNLLSWILAEAKISREEFKMASVFGSHFDITLASRRELHQKKEPPLYSCYLRKEAAGDLIINICW